MKSFKVSLFLLTGVAETVNAQDCEKTWYLTSKTTFTNTESSSPIIKVCRNFKEGLHFDLVKPRVRYFLSNFIFSPNDSPSKTMKNVISSKKLFSFSRYSNFCKFFPSFPRFPDSKGQMEVE